MDRPIEQKKPIERIALVERLLKLMGLKEGASKNNVRIALIVLISLLVLVLLFLVGKSLFNPLMTVETKQLSIATVERAQFDDYIRIQGGVAPISSIQLSAAEGGTVKAILIEEGSDVREGDVIALLDNPMLALNILDSEAQLAEKSNFLRNTQVSMEQERLNLARERLGLENEMVQKSRRARQMQRLRAEKLVSEDEYLEAQEAYSLAKRSQALVMERQRQDSLYRSIQVRQMEESLHSMRLNLEMVRSRAANLALRAPIDGELGQLTLELGQAIAAGTRVGQVNVLSDFKVEAQIDEHYIDRIHKGLKARLERHGEVYELLLSKVYPEVRDKQFRADFQFVGARPEQIRTGQSYQLSLQMGDAEEALLLPRGSFFQNSGGQYVYVLSKDGSRASRRPIKIARQNPRFYEVVEGLQPGEKVITSSYERFGDAKEIKLK